jgi:flavin reductase (DIM6/NTAB) family NADH-FMN oxidoreductase RutF
MYRAFPGIETGFDPTTGTFDEERILNRSAWSYRNGTPVVLISNLNEDGTPNLAPMSSAWWLGWRCMLGLGNVSKTPQNMLRTGECVLNLPSVREVGAVNRLARLTGTEEVLEIKRSLRSRGRWATPTNVGKSRRPA